MNPVNSWITLEDLVRSGVGHTVHASPRKDAQELEHKTDDWHPVDPAKLSEAAAAPGKGAVEGR